jgi:hypothetical protein
MALQSRMPDPLKLVKMGVFINGNDPGLPRQRCEMKAVLGFQFEYNIDAGANPHFAQRDSIVSSASADLHGVLTNRGTATAVTPA